MSKVNIAKIAKDVGICSENLISISESLISISEKVSTVARVIAEIVSEFQGETDKSAIETKTKKAAPKQIKAKAEEDEKKKASWIMLLDVVREVLETCIDVLGFSAPDHM